MKEERVTIINNGLLIEGLLEKSSGDRGVVICHPHPLMGGSMHNNVVEAIREAFAAEKYSTLRFNFRGVGHSTGVYDEGRGEQEDISPRVNIYTIQEYFNYLLPDTLSAPGLVPKSWRRTKILLQPVYFFHRRLTISISTLQN